MVRIAQTEIERLKSEVSVERLIEQSGITLKKAGKDLIGCCPFHDDATASLVVTPVKNLWHCFGCGAAGGVIDWVMKQHGVSFRHAVELLRAGMTGSGDPALAANSALPTAPLKSTPVKKATVPKLAAPIAFNADDQGLLNQVMDYYHDTLKQSPEALAYLERRGFTGQAAMEAITTFKLGLANRTLGLRLPHKNRMAGADIRTRLEKIGIYRASGHEHFNGSLIIPIVDANGQVQEVYGRKLLDNLRAGTPKHLYLPSEHRAGSRGVFNLAAFTACKEIILCEALLDALTFWCAGYRNVTSSYGIEGFTDDMLTAFKQYGTQRVLIAYDRDDAGERGAANVSEKLRSIGIDCFRIQFPKGMDANEYALKVTPAAKSLGVVIRKALWLGNGQAPQREALAPFITPMTAPIIEPVPDQRTAQALAADPVTSVQTRAEPFAAEVEIVLPAMAIPPAPPADVAAEVNAQEVVMGFGTGDDSRRWRVRGMLNNLAVGVLKVNVMVSNSRAFHIDTLDLYAARARAVFLQQAAAELHLSEALLKTELGRVLLKLEQLQDAHLQAALTPQAPATPAMSDTEHAAALALLRTPALLARVLTDFEACGMVGEATNTLTAYLAATSRKLERPLAVVVQSSSAAGKSSLMDAVLALMPPEETVRYSAMSGQSLFYIGATSLKHKILAIAEEAGAARASYALKLLQSDGELTMASTGTDANGNLVTQEYRVEGPMSLFMTTTAIDVDEELMNRCLVLSVDEGRTQTAAIHQRQRERRTLAGLIGRGQREAVLSLHRNAQRLLRPLFVVNPYADRLTFMDDRTRTRRDHDKYLSLIDSIALLHQMQRPVKTAQLNGQVIEYIEVTLADIAHANWLAHEVLGRSLDELPPQTRNLLVLLRDLVHTWAQAQGVARSDIRFSRRALRAACGWGDTQLKVHLARLTELEYLVVHRAGAGSSAGRVTSQGASYQYELLYDGDGRQAAYLSGLIDPVSLGYDGVQSVVSSTQSGSGRDEVGAESASGHMGVSVAMPIVVRHSADRVNESPLTRHPLNGQAASYLQDPSHAPVTPPLVAAGG